MLVAWASFAITAGAAEPVRVRSVAPAKSPEYRRDVSVDLEAEAIHTPVQPRLSKKLGGLPDALINELKRQDRAEAHRRLRIGFAREFDQPVVVNGSTAASGEWTVSPEGWHSWSLEVTSEGALGLRMHIENIKLPQGARLVVLDPAHARAGAKVITARTLAGESEVWTESIFSETVVLECEVPPAVDPGEVSFTVTGLSHFYRSILAGSPRLADGEPDVSCEPEVACYAEWLAEASGIAMMQFVDSGFTYLCTGCLLNDNQPSTFIDYFLTANHCIDNQTVASTLELFWFYQADSCGSSNLSQNFAASTNGGGADFLAGSRANDFTFLRLRQPSPPEATFLGWSTATPGASEQLTIIEHPAGQTKRIAFGNATGYDHDFWEVGWNLGATEEGSSGSPLLNSQGQVIGQLYGGFSNCGNQRGLDTFGRFYLTYRAIRNWIDGPPFFSSKGIYNGLFFPTNSPVHETSGFISINLTPRGTYSGTLLAAGKKYRLTGQFNGTNASSIVTRPGLTALGVNLVMDVSAGAEQITGIVGDGTWQSPLLAKRAPYDLRTNQAPFAGNYTLALPGTNSSQAAPAGNSYGAIKVDASGKVKLTGSLADGTPIMQTAALSRVGDWPFYVPLYGGSGSAFGWMTFAAQTNGDLSGSVNWMKEAQTRAKFYPGGFTNQLAATGSSYRPSFAPITASTVSFSGGNLNSAFSNARSQVKLNFALGTGLFSGSVIPPSGGRISFKGAALEKQNVGYGYFLGGNQSGSVIIGP